MDTVSPPNDESKEKPWRAIGLIASVCLGLGTLLTGIAELVKAVS